MTESIFRKILWTYIAITLLGAATAFYPDYSQNLELAYLNEPDTWLMSNAWIFGTLTGALAIGSIAGLVGLFLFKSWARPLSVVSTLVDHLLSAFMGPLLYSGFGEALLGISAVLWGAILALSYFSAISDQFGR